MKTLEERVATLEARLADLLKPNPSRPIFTPEREELLRQLWQEGLRAGEIMDRMNALPAALPIRNVQSVMQHAKWLGLSRPEGWRSSKYVATPVTWTEARQEILGNLINLIPDADLLEKLNALPGPKVKSAHAMREKAQRLGFLRARPKKPGPDELKWTDERKAFLRENYGRMRPADLLEAVQAMPGGQLSNVESIRRAATRYGIKSARVIPHGFAPRQAPTTRRSAPPPRAPEPEPEPLTAEQQEAIVADRLAKREAHAMDLFSKGKDATSVSATIGIPLREAFRLAGLYRQQKQEAA